MPSGGYEPAPRLQGGDREGHRTPDPGESRMTSQSAVQVSIDGGPPVAGSLDVQVETIDVSMASKTEPDMAWEFVDAFGHYHAWSQEADNPLPTLRGRIRHVECVGHGADGEDCEGYDVTVYDCVICGQPVEPKTITYTSPFRETAPGRKHWTVQVDSDVPLAHGTLYSVRVSIGPELLFGVGTVLTSEFNRDLIPGAYPTTICGVGPLGRRKATKVPA
jgi:hypothetical protein